MLVGTAPHKQSAVVTSVQPIFVAQLKDTVQLMSSDWTSAGMGLALAGGIGYLLRPHGLTADNIINASVVLANGTQVEPSQCFTSL